jgi:uncharacterized membrane protein HdeD (DUF308 family)
MSHRFLRHLAMCLILIASGGIATENLRLLTDYRMPYDAGWGWVKLSVLFIVVVPLLMWWNGPDEI